MYSLFSLLDLFKVSVTNQNRIKYIITTQVDSSVRGYLNFRK